jgi:hypothetical protein
MAKRLFINSEANIPIHDSRSGGQRRGMQARQAIFTRFSRGHRDKSDSRKLVLPDAKKSFGKGKLYW